MRISTRISICLQSLIRLYQRFISPLLPPACRFYPSCSEYAHQSVALHGPWKGSWLALRRVCRCNPLHPGGLDPVPPVHHTIYISPQE